MVDQGTQETSISDLRKQAINQDEFIKAHEGVLEYFKDSNDLESMIKVYDKVGIEYERQMDGIRFQDPIHAADLAIKYSNGSNDVSILDIGSGTGALGKALNDKGYTNVSALDGSQGMLDAAIKLGIYKEANKCIIGIDEFPDKLLAAYDIVTSTGCFFPNHFPPAAFDRLIDCAKVGGIVIFSIIDYLITEENEGGFYEKIQEIRKSGRIEELEIFKFKKYEGVNIGKFQERDGNVIVWKRII